MSTYMLLIIEPPAQRATRTEAQGREVYARMQIFGEGLREQGKLLAVDKALQRYHLLHAVHGDLLQKLGRRDDAQAALHQAAALARNEKERALLSQRAQE